MPNLVPFLMTVSLILPLKSRLKFLGFFNDSKTDEQHSYSWKKRCLYWQAKLAEFLSQAFQVGQESLEGETFRTEANHILQKA